MMPASASGLSITPGSRRNLRWRSSVTRKDAAVHPHVLADHRSHVGDRAPISWSSARVQRLSPCSRLGHARPLSSHGWARRRARFRLGGARPRRGRHLISRWAVKARAGRVAVGVIEHGERVRRVGGPRRAWTCCRDLRVHRLFPGPGFEQAPLLQVGPGKRVSGSLRSHASTSSLERYLVGSSDVVCTPRR